MLRMRCHPGRATRPRQRRAHDLAVRGFDWASQRSASEVMDAGDGPRYGVPCPYAHIPPSDFTLSRPWDGLAFLGCVRTRGSVVTVKSGLVGRPAVLHLDEIMSITAAQEHPDVATDGPAAAARDGVAATCSAVLPST